jgi:raffinose/stachyose/melibiose transport system substrate-binding protein
MLASTIAVTANASEGITLRFIYIWPEHAETMDKSVEMIEEKYGFDVNVSVVPWNEITTTIQTAVASNDMYDVFFSWGGQIPGYNQLNAVLNLTPYLEADPEWKDSLVSQGHWNDYKDGDNVYGIPFRGTGTFLIYNKTLFEEKGYTVPQTSEELEELMATMKADGITPFAMPGAPHGFQVVSTNQRVIDYILLEAGILGTKEHLTARTLDYGGLLAQGAEKTREWYKLGYFGENPFGVQREEAQSVFFMGNSGMLFCNNNELMDLRKLEEEFGIEVDSFMFPAPASAPEKIGYGGMNDGFAAYSGTQYPDEAVNLLKGLMMPEVQLLWGDEAKSVMCTKDIPYADPLLVKFAEEFANAGKFNVIADYNTGSLGDLQGDLLVEFMISDMTPEAYEAGYVELRANAIRDAESDD